MVYSFDIFDTVVCRPATTPWHLLYLVGQVLKDEKLVYDIGDWVEVRRSALMKAKARKLPEQEITIDEIYEFVSTECKWSREETSFAINAEIDMEISVCLPIDENVIRINELRKLGKHIIFISDMYLPGSAIKTILKNAGVLKPGDRVYVSSDIGVTKAVGGKLFEEVLKMEGISASELRHLGDNYEADFAVPKGLGIDAMQYKGSELNEAERLMLEELDELEGSFEAGKARCMRLSGFGL